MDYREDIEQLVKNTFDNFESDVSPHLWTNIQNGLSVQPASNSGSGGNNVSTGTKLTGIASKFSVVNIIGTVATIIGITASVIYFSSDKKPAINNPASESKTVQNSIPVASTEAEAKDLIKNDIAKKTEEPVVSISQKVDNKKETPSGNKMAYFSSTNDDVPVASIDKKDIIKVADDKIRNEEAQEPANKMQADAADTDNKKSKDNNDLEYGSSSQDAEAAITENPEQKSIEYYLGNIPNVITANGDGNNDVFVIEGKDIKSLNVTISDRSGKIIHHWNSLHGFWDGKTENGKTAKEGTYFYNIFAQPKTGKPITKTGTLHLFLN